MASVRGLLNIQSLNELTYEKFVSFVTALIPAVRGRRRIRDRRLDSISRFGNRRCPAPCSYM
jgi:hypothetical protein